MFPQSPKITVVVPNFNHGHLIGECIDGLLNQDFTDFKVVIIDDNSTNQSVSTIVDKIVGDKRFELIRLETNIGVLAVQNMALENVNSDYLYLAAADDYILPNFFSDLIEILTNNPEIAFASKKCLVPIANQSLTYISRPIFTPHKFKSIFSPREASEQLMKTDFRYVTGASLIRTQKFKSLGNLRNDLGAFADGIHLRKLAVRYGYAFINDYGLVWRRVESGFSITELQKNDEFARKLSKIALEISEDSNFKTEYASILIRRLTFMSRMNKLFSTSNYSFSKFAILKNFVRTHSLAFFYILIYRPFPVSSMINLSKANRVFKYQMSD